MVFRRNGLGISGSGWRTLFRGAAAWGVALAGLHCGGPGEPQGGVDTLVSSGDRITSTTPVDTAAPASASLEGSRPSTVVLISLDGTRPEDVTQKSTPSLFAMGEQGLRGEGLIPVNPSNTFPSHVSLATGVPPEVHRLVNNRFIDPERGQFKRDDPNAWIESEPIWSIAERSGVRAAAYYWVGSEGPWSGGPGPSETRQFSGRTTEKTKVNRILKWLGSTDPLTRPRLIMAWFHGADRAGHASGPGGPSVAAALAPQDRQIARLVEEMQTLGLFETTTLIFVADHGMTGASRRINLGKELGRAGLKPSVLGMGGFSSLVFKGKTRTEKNLERAVVLARGLGLEAFRREAAPGAWQVRDPRFGDVVVRAPIGTAIVSTTTQAAGFHGYDAQAPEMHGVLLARGRGVVPGTKLGRVSSLAIAPTVLSLLGLPIPPQMQESPLRELLSGIALDRPQMKSERP
jgi:hypothetical protein